MDKPITNEMEDKFLENAPELKYIDFTRTNTDLDVIFSISEEKIGEYELYRGIRACNGAEKVQPIAKIKRYIEQVIENTSAPNFNFISYRKISFLTLKKEYNLPVNKREDIENIIGKTIEDKKFVITSLKKEKITPTDDQLQENNNKNIVFLRYHIIGSCYNADTDETYCVPGIYLKDQSLYKEINNNEKSKFVINSNSKSYISGQIDYEKVGKINIPILNLYVIPSVRITNENELKPNTRNLTKK